MNFVDGMSIACVVVLLVSAWILAVWLGGWLNERFQ